MSVKENDCTSSQDESGDSHCALRRSGIDIRLLGFDVCDFNHFSGSLPLIGTGGENDMQDE
jgi:hypothetical protein